MRCKNCGSENNDNLYICQNCGSPLYDEEEPIAGAGDETRVFGTLDDPNNTKTPMEAAAERAAAREAAEEERKRKQQTTLIAVLAVVLAVIIAATVFAVIHAKSAGNEEETSDISVSESIPDESTSERTTEKQTTESTTEETTEATTEESTTEEEKSFTVSLSANDGGSIDGNGTFKLGDNATVTATADSGYEFDGWYKGSSKVSSNAVYTFTVTENTSLKAVFRIVDTEPEEPSIDTDESDEEL